MEDLSQKNRLIFISDIQKNPKKRSWNTSKTLSKYQKTYRIMNSISVATGSLARRSLEVTLSSIANPLITIPSACVSAILGSIAFVTGVWTKCLFQKAEKYVEYRSTVETKLKSTKKKLSRSLDDNKVTAEEHLNYITEYESYQKLEKKLGKKI